MDGGRVLDASRAYKPLDVGNGAVATSVGGDGRLLAVSGFHPALGYAVLDGSPPFEDAARYDPMAVRGYRAGLAAGSAPGFGVTSANRWQARRARLLADVVPVLDLDGGTVTAEVTTWAPPESHAVVQRWRLRPAGPAPAVWAWQVVAPRHLGRAALTQLTEGGVLEGHAAATRVTAADDTLIVTAPGADLAAAIVGLPAQADGATGQLAVGPSGVELTVATALAGSSEQARGRAVAARDAAMAGDESVGPEAVAAAMLPRWRDLDPRLPPAALLPAHRAVAYLLDCCALPVGDGCCLLTDHRILPLSWTRDAYYAARLLLHGPGGPALVGRHLRWLFETAAREDGTWARAYLPNGVAKDRAFQLDQQCYPLLELADFVLAGGDPALVHRLAPQVASVLDALESRRAGALPLYATEETPGDDPLAQPYHCSSHVLLWRTLARLAAAGLADTAATAEAVRDETRRWFTVEVNGTRRFAYAVDLDGDWHDYHDANDLPTALAPAWGFCSPTDPVWAATVAHAFSPANAGGWYGGRLGGLGSAHTPGAWPLGDVQEVVVARTVGDRERATAVLRRLTRTACWDGSLPEARDPQTGAVRSRHWFAWPGAALVLALLDAW